jgi:hypothetical protein
MATLRQLIDGSTEVFYATVAGHNDKRVGTVFTVKMPKRYQQQYRPHISAAEHQAQQYVNQSVNQYVYEVAATGEKLQQEYQRGYHEGYVDGVRASSASRVEESKPAVPKVPVLQSNREINLEE